MPMSVLSPEAASSVLIGLIVAGFGPLARRLWQHLGIDHQLESTETARTRAKEALTAGAVGLAHRNYRRAIRHRTRIEHYEGGLPTNVERAWWCAVVAAVVLWVLIVPFLSVEGPLLVALSLVQFSTMVTTSLAVFWLGVEYWHWRRTARHHAIHWVRQEFSIEELARLSRGGSEGRAPGDVVSGSGHLRGVWMLRLAGWAAIAWWWQAVQRRTRAPMLSRAYRVCLVLCAAMFGWLLVVGGVIAGCRGRWYWVQRVYAREGLQYTDDLGAMVRLRRVGRDKAVLDNLLTSDPWSKKHPALPLRRYHRDVLQLLDREQRTLTLTAATPELAAVYRRLIPGLREVGHDRLHRTRLRRLPSRPSTGSTRWT